MKCVIIISSTKERGIRYCLEWGIDPKQAMFIGEDPYAIRRYFNNNDDIHIVDPEELKQSFLDALLPCFWYIGVPPELEASFRADAGT